MCDDTRKHFCAINFRISSVFSMQYIFEVQIALSRDCGATNLVFTTSGHGVCLLVARQWVIIIIIVTIFIIIIISTWLSYLYVLLGPRQGSPEEPSAANYSCYSPICCCFLVVLCSYFKHFILINVALSSCYSHIGCRS